MCSPLDGERAGSILSPRGANRLSGVLGGRSGQRRQDGGHLLPVHRAAQRSSHELAAGGLVGAPRVDVAPSTGQHLAGIDNDHAGVVVPGEPDQPGLRQPSAAAEAGADGWGHAPILRVPSPAPDPQPTPSFTGAGPTAGTDWMAVQTQIEGVTWTRRRRSDSGWVARFSRWERRSAWAPSLRTSAAPTPRRPRPGTGRTAGPEATAPARAAGWTRLPWPRPSPPSSAWTRRRWPRPSRR